MLFGLVALILAYHYFYFRLTVTFDMIVIEHPLRGKFAITRWNSILEYRGWMRGSHIFRFTVDDGRKVRVYYPQFDTREYVGPIRSYTG